MLFLSSADSFKNKLFEKILSGIPSESQTVWILIWPDDSSGLIWVHTVCHGYEQTTLVDKEFKLQLDPDKLVTKTHPIQYTEIFHGCKMIIFR